MTEFGIVTDAKLEQLEKTKSPILVTDPTIITDAKLEHSSKA